MATFTSFCRTIITNAASYRSEASCQSMLTKLNAAFAEAGSYGVLQDDRRDAMEAIQDRVALLRLM